MFEIGFSELIMLGLVSLLVIGPERLPKAARVVGFWLGKTQRLLSNLKTEIKYELHAEEIRQTLAQQTQTHRHEFEQLFDELNHPQSSSTPDNSNSATVPPNEPK